MGVKPVYLVAGGRSEARRGAISLLREAVGSVGKKEPALAYVGAASGDSIPFRLLISQFLKAAGAGAIQAVKLCGKRCDISAARAVLDACDAVFVSGGDVEEGMRVMERTDMIPHLALLASQGKPFIGLSAGSIMLARAWIRWRDPDDDSSAELFPCLGIVPICCDTHDEDSGWSELQSLLSLMPEGEEAWGIPSGGALVVAPDGSVAPLGAVPARYRRGPSSVFPI